MMVKLGRPQPSVTTFWEKRRGEKPSFGQGESARSRINLQTSMYLAAQGVEKGLKTVHGGPASRYKMERKALSQSNGVEMEGERMWERGGGQSRKIFQAPGEQT